MALIECAECERQVSDKAAACPGCGAPIAAPHSPAAPASSSPVMRAGAKWEGLGFLLIVAGMIIGMAGAGGLGWTCAIVGLVMFIVGRFQ